MNCWELPPVLDAWLDNEVDAATAEVIQRHLDQCAACQAIAAAAREEQQGWRSALADSTAAERVLERAMARISQEHAAATIARQPSSWQALLMPLLYLAAGYLLALLLAEDGAPPAAVPPPVPNSTAASPAPPRPMPVARMVAATRPIEQFDENLQRWVAVPEVPIFTCSSDTRLRTPPDGRCELKTGDGCVIRPNDRTEVTLLGSSSIELRQGQVWCRSPDDVSLEVRIAPATSAGKPATDAAPPSTMWSVGPSCVMTGIQEAGRIQVMNAAGVINLRTPRDEQRLAAGQVAEISDGQVITPGTHVDPLLATRWMHPLLVSPAGDRGELQDRVDTLLAHIGRSKLAHLYEQEIRSLGEHATLPLVKFIQSPLSSDDPMRRMTAMQLTADLAPVWMIPELIALLEDREPMVRKLAARALLRLTGMDMNVSGEEWQEPANAKQATALAEWRAWWQTHRSQFPAPAEQD